MDFYLLGCLLFASKPQGSYGGRCGASRGVFGGALNFVAPHGAAWGGGGGPGSVCIAHLPPKHHLLTATSAACGASLGGRVAHSRACHAPRTTASGRHAWPAFFRVAMSLQPASSSTRAYGAFCSCASVSMNSRPCPSMAQWSGARAGRQGVRFSSGGGGRGLNVCWEYPTHAGRSPFCKEECGIPNTQTKKKDSKLYPNVGKVRKYTQMIFFEQLNICKK